MEAQLYRRGLEGWGGGGIKRPFSPVDDLFVITRLFPLVRRAKAREKMVAHKQGARRA